MRVTISRLSIAQELIEVGEEAGFEWFSRSRTKKIRQFNGGLVDQCAYLNSILPQNSSYLWEVTSVGATDVIRRTDNPNFVAPVHNNPAGQAEASEVNERPTNAKRLRTSVDH